MKKTKIVVATLTAATLALGCAAFVACGEKDPDPVLYEVTFNANGGTYAENKETVKVKADENGKIATPPTDPTRADYTFVSYSTTKDDANTKITIKDYKFTKDTTVYALWTAKENPPTGYTITLDAGTNGSVTEESLTTTDGKLASLPTPTANSGYYFKGWYDAATDGTEVTTDTVFEADGTIYAYYGNEYTLTLDAGTNGTLAGDATVKARDGELTSLPTPTANSGYYFKGWYDAATDGTEVTTDTVIEEDGTIYAIYGTEYTLTLDAGTNGTLAGDATVKARDGVLASLPTPTANSGYYFLGWYDAATDGTEVTTDTVIEASGTIYAIYGAEVTITLDAHGGTLAGDATVTTTNGKLIALPAAPTAPTVADGETPQQFIGWYTAATEGEKITTEKVFTEAATIHAQWQDKDGVYSSDGAFLMALEEIDNGGFVRQLSCVVELEANQVIKFTINGEVIAHNAGVHEMWDDGGCHGVKFNQAAGTFTAREAGEFTVYAKYWGDPATKDGWTFTITDGKKDPDGVYLVGEKFDGAAWSSSEDRLIDSAEGLNVTFTTDSKFKATSYSREANEGKGGLLWDYNDSAKYAYGEGTSADDITLPGNDNGTVKVAGTYNFKLNEQGIVIITKVVTPTGGDVEGGEEQA